MSAADEHRPNYRALWAAVVIQALDDIESEPMASAAFTDAEAFFTRMGAWGEARMAIADFLDLHPDDLERVGRRALAMRRAGEASRPTAARLRRAILPAHTPEFVPSLALAKSQAAGAGRNQQFDERPGL